VKDAADYLAHVRMRIIRSPGVIHWRVVREEIQGAMGLLRYRLALRDGGQLEAFERFDIVEGKVRVLKYSFHWQDATGRRIKRWDNAAHHPEVATCPDHVHEGAEQNVLPHESVTFEDVLALVQ
jgi:uncharacterized protein DUF6516